MIEVILENYLLPIITIIGMVEFFKNIKKYGFTSKQIYQIFFSILWAIKNEGITSVWFISIPWSMMVMISLSTLFWNYVFKKIRDFKKSGIGYEK